MIIPLFLLASCNSYYFPLWVETPERIINSEEKNEYYEKKCIGKPKSLGYPFFDTLEFDDKKRRIVKDTEYKSQYENVTKT